MRDGSAASSGDGGPRSPASGAGAISVFRAGLSTLDVEELPDSDRLELLSELELLTRAVAGVAVQTQVAFHTSQVASQVQAGVAPSRAGRAVPDDLAQARRTSPYWGSRELTSAKALVLEMPRTLAALERGDISLYQSRIVTEATACLDPADRAEVDRRLVDALAGASTAEIGAAVRGLVYEIDPRGYVTRARRAAKDRGVSIRPRPDVMALLSARLPAPQAIACYTALKGKAVEMQASGDPRTLGQLMADLLFERLTGRSVVDGVDVEIGVVITDSALFDGTSEAADLVGYGPIPAEMARDLLRPEGLHDEAPAEADPRHPVAEQDEQADAPGDRGERDAPGSDVPREAKDQSPAEVCPDGGRCSSWSCPLLHGSPEALNVPSSAAHGSSPIGRTPPRTPASPPQPAAPTRPPPPSAATKAAKVWLRRLWSDPATGILIGRDTRKRLFTGSLRAALVARDKTCRNAWCGAPIRAIDHKVRARDGGPTSDTNGQGLCQRCNNAREHPRATLPSPDDYRHPPPLLPTYLADRAPPSGARPGSPSAA